MQLSHDAQLVILGAVIALIFSLITGAFQYWLDYRRQREFYKWQKDQDRKDVIMPTDEFLARYPEFREWVEKYDKIKINAVLTENMTLDFRLYRLLKAQERRILIDLSVIVGLMIFCAFLVFVVL
jgi:hypothetical protein